MESIITNEIPPYNLEEINYIVQSLLSGDASILADKIFIFKFSETIKLFINNPHVILNDYEIALLGEILHIGNILYNNTSIDEVFLPFESGVYDILLERYKNYRIPQVGAEPVVFTILPNNGYGKELGVPLVSFYDKEMLYGDELIHNNIQPTLQSLGNNLISFNGYATDKKIRDTAHDNPSLVGTLDKCKYVLNKQALDKGVFDDPSVKILERDFFEPHFKRGLINKSTIFSIIMELKYDGVSVVVSIKNGMVVKAISRGDTGIDKALDYTGIFYGYHFPNLPSNIRIDVKCEAVITHQDLYYFNQKFRPNDPYKNCRSAIIGITGSNDGYLYRDYITLVPLQPAPISDDEDMDVNECTLLFEDRIQEIEFCNKYLATKEYLRYSVATGTFDKVMFMIKKFVEEAEYIRPLMKTMYDGIVISYLDNSIRAVLGRENSINKYSIAVKFNAMKKFTTLTGVGFTIGKNGLVTPMAYYTPVEFFGGIHTKSSISSVARFNENQFKIGNTIEVEYRNDVMPYVTTPNLDVNLDNPNPILEFITKCPYCGSNLEFSKTGKSARCPNPSCDARRTARMTDTLSILGFNGIAESTIIDLNLYSFKSFMTAPNEYIKNIYPELTGDNIIAEREKFFNSNQYDYIIMGSLGFSDISCETWLKILAVYDIKNIYDMYMYNNDDLKRMLCNIKGIGPSKADTILHEFIYFIDDIEYILNSIPCIIINTKGNKLIKIRFTGCRDAELFKYLKSLGVNAGEGSVTTDTDLLVRLDENYTSAKTKLAGEYGINVITMQEFKDNLNYYIQ